MTRLPARRLALYGALLIAGLLVAVTIGRGGFVPLIADSSGYISAGELWRRHDIFRPEPLPLWAAWPNAAGIGAALSYRAGPIAGTSVSLYPAGFPMLIAAASALAGPLGGYLVAPAMGGLLVCCAFGLARRIGGDLCGLLAAVLIAANPVVLLQAVHPMSDLPAAACWTLAWLLALRGTRGAGAAAGLAVTLAILIRPNLAPLGLVIAATFLLGGADRVRGLPASWRWRATGIYLAAAALGPLLVAWSQTILYGGVFASGYGEWHGLFSAAHVWPNLGIYPRLMAQTHTLLPLIGLVLAPLVLFSKAPFLSREGRVIVLSGTAILVVNLALYLPYIPFDHWPFLRFLLPGLTALIVLFAAVLTHVVSAIWSRARWLAVMVPALAIMVIAQGAPFARYAVNDWEAQTRIRLMGHYLREVLPANAAVLSCLHSGALAYYTGREVVRLDLIEPTMLDQAVADLRRHGYRPVFVLDQAMEDEVLRERFQSSDFARLDWAPRAVFATTTAIRYFDLADRDSYRDGTRWPTDTLR